MAGALTYRGFSAAPDFAVKEAYLLNLAQAAVEVDRVATGEVLAEYVVGDIDFDRAASDLLDLANGAASPAEIAATKEG